ncbi:hypothetical protein D1872_156670 [compost metagenome]
MDFKGVSLPFEVGPMLTTAVEFLGIYKGFILTVLGVLAGWILSGPVIRLISHVGAKYSDFMASRRDFDSVTPRREMYDYLTKTGRIKERDEWVRKTGNPYS